MQTLCLYLLTPQRVRIRCEIVPLLYPLSHCFYTCGKFFSNPLKDFIVAAVGCMFAHFLEYPVWALDDVAAFVLVRSNLVFVERILVHLLVVGNIVEVLCSNRAHLSQAM